MGFMPEAVEQFSKAHGFYQPREVGQPGRRLMFHGHARCTGGTFAGIIQAVRLPHEQVVILTPSLRQCDLIFKKLKNYTVNGEPKVVRNDSAHLPLVIELGPQKTIYVDVATGQGWRDELAQNTGPALIIGEVVNAWTDKSVETFVEFIQNQYREDAVPDMLLLTGSRGGKEEDERICRIAEQVSANVVDDYKDYVSYYAPDLEDVSDLDEYITRLKALFASVYLPPASGYAFR